MLGNLTNNFRSYVRLRKGGDIVGVNSWIIHQMPKNLADLEVAQDTFSIGVGLNQDVHTDDGVRVELFRRAQGVDWPAGDLFDAL